MIVTLTPNPSLDKTYHIDAFVHEGVNRVTDVTVEAAGKGVNVARGLYAGGFETIAVVPIGGSDGRLYEDLMTAAAVPHRAVPIRGNTRSNVSVVERNGATTKLNEPGPALDATEVTSLVEAAAGLCSDGDWLAACGSLPPGVPTDLYGRVVGRAHEVGARVAVDASGDALAEAVKAGPDLIKPNAAELTELVGRSLSTLDDVVRACRTLVEGGVGAVLVSLGGDGAVFVDRGEAIHGAAAVDRVRNTVGAGDTLLAGFLAGGEDRRNALATALTWARAAVRSPETAMATPSEDDRLAVRLSERVPRERVVHGT